MSRETVRVGGRFTIDRPPREGLGPARLVGRILMIVAGAAAILFYLLIAKRTASPAAPKAVLSVREEPVEHDVSQISTERPAQSQLDFEEEADRTGDLPLPQPHDASSFSAPQVLDSGEALAQPK